ncbi:MAG: hypothetical protein C0596_09220 [Marinilabiliales bacterium]|nr:MAG: hypothetical protein C0596_09220 [Marinilabiliales bacterium]
MTDLLIFLALLIYSNQSGKEATYTQINRENNQIIIPVNDVKISKYKLDEISYLELVNIIDDAKIEAIPTDMHDKKLVYTQMHPLVAGLHYSFAQHRPFVLSPDMVWLMILQGLSQHIYYNSDSLKPLLYTDTAKSNISVRRDHFIKNNMDNDWASVFPEFLDTLKQRTKPEIHSLFSNKFTTTTDNISISYTIALMDAVSEQFDFCVITACGIPYIVLEGSPEDWKWIKDNLPKLKKYDTDFWIDNLQQVVDEIYKSSLGNVNTEFWQSIYKWNTGSGGPWVSGWIIKFFPYLANDEHKEIKNEYLNYSVYDKDVDGFGYYMGLMGEDFPTGMSTCDFTWIYYLLEIPMQFKSGFIGFSQNDKMEIRPEISWYISDRSIIDNIDTLKNFDMESFFASSSNTTEVDYINAYESANEGFYIDLEENPDNLPIYEYKEGKTYEQGIKELEESINIYIDYPFDPCQFEMTLVISAKGTPYFINAETDNRVLKNMLSNIVSMLYRWEPANKNGKPVNAKITFTFHLTGNNYNY